jgi:hypothetical protein
MLYIIGGAARSGKSILVHRMLTEKLIPYFPLDGLVGMLKNSAPEHEVTHSLPFIEKSENTWKFSNSLLKYFIKTQEIYAVEGDCILPKHIAELQVKYSENIRCCFLGYCNVSSKQKLDLVRNFNRGEKDWTNKHDDDAMVVMIEKMIEYSIYLKEECKKYNIAFFDVSEDFEKAQDDAFEFLFDDN